MRSLLFLALLAGCPGSEVACDLMAVSSVTVDLVAEDGGDLSGATVTYVVDGADPVPCDAFDGSFACGYEVAGVLTIRAEAEGYDAIEQDVTVEQDVCHVVTEQLSLTMAVESVDCTEEVVPSVLATVVGSSGEELSGVEVIWSRTDSEAAAQACTNDGGDVWQCGEEVAAELEIFATADGHVGETQIVTVGADECHVITESLSFELDWAPD
jgi:hypothetical protein